MHKRAGFRGTFMVLAIIVGGCEGAPVEPIPIATSDASGDSAPSDSASASDAAASSSGAADAGASSSGTTDITASSSGATDTAGSSSGTTDATAASSGGADAAASSSGITDAGGSSSGTTDAGGSSSGTTDAGGSSSGTTDAGGSSSGTTDAGGDNGCCKSDSACAGGICLGAATGNGVCKTTSTLGAGQCWTDAHCGAKEGACVGAFACPCNAKCSIPDGPGKCEDSSGPKKCSMGLGAPTIDCGAGSFCKLDSAYTCVGVGECAKKPEACTMQYDPVCGCDGKVHGNYCSANSAGQNAQNKGECQLNPCATKKCGDGNPCTSDSCNPKTGNCEFAPLAKGTACEDGDKCTLNDQCDGASGCSPGSKDPNCGGAPGCCGSDQDCGGQSTCIGGSGGGKGMCKDSSQLTKGQCWSGADCGGVKCLGASICPCGAQCIVADKPGTCDGAPAEGCCNTDKDCKAGAQVCFQGPWNAYKCMDYTQLPKGKCWTDAQCGQGSKCENAMACGCQAFCKAMDKPGDCSVPVVNPCATVKCGLDNNPCTDDLCDPKTGQCIHPPKATGTACDDGNACTVKDTCVVAAGVAACVPGLPMLCKPSDACHTSACDANSGQCVQTPIPGCGGNKFCSIGLGAPTIDCGKGNYCKLGVNGCVGVGSCAPIPQICTKELKWVCGCDKNDYSNGCMASAAGQNIMSDGQCGGGGTGTGCCSADQDCKTQLCVVSFLGSKGMCKDPAGLQKGECWNDQQCGGGKCLGASVCACGMNCLLPDKPGTCLKIGGA